MLARALFVAILRDHSAGCLRSHRVTLERAKTGIRCAARHHRERRQRCEGEEDPAAKHACMLGHEAHAMVASQSSVALACSGSTPTGSDELAVIGYLFH